MTMFHLVSFENGRSITLDSNTCLLGRVAGTDRAVPTDAAASRSS
jgi:hypothetical protein